MMNDLAILQELQPMAEGILDRLCRVLAVGGASAMVLDSSNQRLLAVASRGIQPDDTEDPPVEVLEGLKEDEHIVTSANFLLDSESQLKAAVSGMKGMQH